MKVLLHPIGGPAAPLAGEFGDETAHLRGLEAQLDARRAVVKEGWGPEKVHRKGKLTTWERVDQLVDQGSPVLPIGSFVNWGRDFPGSERQAPVRGWSRPSPASRGAGWSSSRMTTPSRAAPGGR